MYDLAHVICCFTDSCTNKHEFVILCTGLRQDCLEALEQYTNDSESNKVFFVNEEFMGNTIIREFATIEKGYNHTLILIDSKNVIKTLNKVNNMKNT